MEVILKQDIANVGKMGDVVNVREGYARNYLLPRGLVLVANKRNLNAFEHQKRIVESQKERAQKEAQTLSGKLAALTLMLSAKAGEEGKLFGSVTNIDIERALKDQGFTVDRRKIDLPGPIKALGEYAVPVRLPLDVTATVKVKVVAEGEKAP